MLRNRIVMVAALIVAVATGVSAQTVRRLPCGYWCQEFGPVPTWTRLIPTAPVQPITFEIPKRIGAVVAFNDMPVYYPPGYRIGISLATETNATAAKIAAANGIRAMKFWPRVSALGADMSWVYRASDLDVIVVRPLQDAISDEYNDCSTGVVVWEAADYGLIAENLLRRFGDVEKTIILTGWESDHQACGVACTPDTHPWYPGELAPYGDYVLRMLNERQLGIEAARAMYPDAMLQVLHAVEISSIDDNWNVARDVIPEMTHEPDLISVTYWHWGDYSITEMLDYVQAYSGLPRSRFLLGEIGGPEPTQYNRISGGVSEAFEWGVSLAFVWHWKQAWPGDNYGVWKKNESGGFTGEPTAGLAAIHYLIDCYEEN